MRAVDRPTAFGTHAAFLAATQVVAAIRADANGRRLSRSRVGQEHGATNRKRQCAHHCADEAQPPGRRPTESADIKFATKRENCIPCQQNCCECKQSTYSQQNDDNDALHASQSESPAPNLLRSVDHCNSVLRSLPLRRHLDDPGVEAGDDFDEVGLGGHDGFDVLVHRGHFVEAGGDQVHLALLQQLLRVRP